MEARQRILNGGGQGALRALVAAVHCIFFSLASMGRGYCVNQRVVGTIGVRCSAVRRTLFVRTFVVRCPLTCFFFFYISLGCALFGPLSWHSVE